MESVRYPLKRGYEWKCGVLRPDGLGPGLRCVELSKILKLSNQEYLKQIDSDISYVMCKENDSSTIEKIDNLIRKMSD